MNTVNIVILQNIFSFSGLYGENHVVHIQRQAKGLNVYIVDPTKDALDSLLHTAHIVVAGSREYRTYVDSSNVTMLRWVHITSAGVEGVVDSLKTTNILLTNSSGASAISIAEHVMAYMLMFSRRLHVLHRIQVEKKRWTSWDAEYVPIELYNKTIGIVGFGRIGKRVAQLAKQFGMRVVALEYNRKIHTTYVDDIVSRSELKDLLQQSDFIVDCLPLTAETNRFFSYQQFALMKQSAFFINIGRGKTVAQDDLIQVLKEKKLAGAGLDVFEEEPLPASSELWNIPSVIITPHCAGQTAAYIDRVVDIFCMNLRASLQHKLMPNLVDKSSGY